MSSSIEITPELMAGFLDEAPEYLEMLDSGLMEFESQVGSGTLSLETPEDQDRMNTMFRAAHSLKGLAAAFGFDRIKELTHRMETLFDQIRMKKRTLAADGIDTLFHVFDRLKLLVRELTDDSGEPVQIDDLLSTLNRILEGTCDPSAPAEKSERDAANQPAHPASDGPAVDANANAGARDANVEVPAGPFASMNAEQSEVFSDPELAAIFVETTSEAIDELNQGLLGLEENPANGDLLNKVFRCAHNIKGASGAAGLFGMNRLTHDLETVFDRLRSNRVRLDEEMMNAMFRAVDRLRGVIDRIREGHIEDVGSEELGDLFMTWTTSQDHPAEESSHHAAAGSPEPAGEACDAASPTMDDDGAALEEGQVRVVVEFPEAFDEAAIQAYLIHNKLGDVGQIITTEPDLDALAADTPLNVITFLIKTDADPDEIEAIIGGYSVKKVTVSGDPGLKGAGSTVRAESAAESLVIQPGAERARDSAVPPSGDALHPAEGQDTSPTAKPVTASVLGAFTASATPASSSTNTAGGSPSRDGGGNRPKSGKPETPPMKTTETLRVDQERLDELMNLGGELVINRARFLQIHGRFREVFDGKNVGYLVDDINERLTQLNTQLETLQVDNGKCHAVDSLLSELVHLKDSFDPVCALVGKVHQARSSMVDFDEALHALSRVSEGIQKGIMGTRMVPIGPLFNRFRRVIRDIAKSSGKKINLVLQGEHTELDKRMIDELGDPLTHMVRNSVDHGIEMPDQRVAAGKNPAGTLVLEACHRGNSICVQVRDDGAGLNLERIRSKIIERELATPAQVEAMSDRELHQYIFKPGFSTAAKITEVSGRGMGMDIVVNKIEKLSGTIEVDSEEGRGTTVVIKLPLTLAIMTSMVSRIGNGIYAIPLETVAEIITVHRRDIQYIQRREVVRVRERVIPLTRFEDIFETDLPGLRTTTRDADELTLVIIGFEDNKIGLVVDELLGQEDVVIKSIAENYTNVRGIAGASIRGDGTVSLILDVGAMMEMASRTVTNAVSEPPQPACLQE